MFVTNPLFPVMSIFHDHPLQCTSSFAASLPRVTAQPPSVLYIASDTLLSILAFAFALFAIYTSTRFTHTLSVLLSIDASIANVDVASKGSLCHSQAASASSHFSRSSPHLGPKAPIISAIQTRLSQDDHEISSRRSFHTINFGNPTAIDIVDQCHSFCLFLYRNQAPLITSTVRPYPGQFLP